MTIQFHGVTSLGLVLVALGIAAVAAFQVSWVLGSVYLLLCAGAALAILYAYCAKCPCRQHCGHVLPGRAAMWLNGRRPGPYTAVESGALVLALASLIGLPQAWLWQNLWLFTAFWMLTAVAVVQIRTVVCHACKNVHCPLRVRVRL
jgi:hypothetical protein